MATVHRLRVDPAGPSLAEAITGYLATLDHPESAGIRRVYAGTLTALRADLGADRPIADLAEPAAATQLTAWFTGRRGQRAPATFNRNLDALRAALGYWHDQGWLDPADDPTRSLRRRDRAPDRTRALSRAEVEALLGREDLGLRERTLWRLLYKTAARAGEVLALDVEELDLRSRCAKVRRKGNAADVIVWQTPAARLLPACSRAAGPARCSSPTAAPASSSHPATSTRPPTTLPDEERAIVRRYVRVAGDLAQSSLLNSSKESYSYQLPQGPGGPEQIEKSFSPKDVQVGFAGLLRQADSGDEPANFHFVSQILMGASETAQDDRHDERIKQLKAWRYAVKELHDRSLDQLSRNKLVQEGLQLFAYEEEHSPKELLNLYNYGDLIHWRKHRDVIAGFEQDEYIATDRQLAYLEAAQSLGHLYVGFGELGRHAIGEAPPEREP